MFVFTHWMIGKYFAKKMRLSHRTFSRKWFLYGNIYPDISKLSKAPHYMEESRSTMQLYMDKAQNTDDLKDLSFNLGVVCHYLCDYFCKVHGKSKVQTFKHFLYEFELHFYIMKLLSDDLIMSNKVIIDAYRRKGFSQVTLNLEKALKYYYEEDKDMVHDGHYALLSINQIFKMFFGFNALGIIGCPENMNVSYKKSYAS